MPPLSAYTPFESLLFFQSLATSDVRPASFASISALLSNNPHVRQHVAFSADRLSPEALEDLYATLLRDGFDRESGLNGRPTDSSGPSNPKKRKISSPRPDGLSGGAAHAILVPELVAHLYAGYKELVTKEIREDERRYTQIKDEIERLQKEGAGATAAPTVDAKALPALPMDIDVKQEKPQPDESLKSTAPHMRPAEESRGDEPVLGPSQSAQAGEPAALDVTEQGTGAPGKAEPSTEPNGQKPTQAPIPPPLAPRTQQTVPGTPTAPSSAVPHPSQLAPRPIISTPMNKAGNEPTPTQSSFQQWQLEPPPHSPYSAVSPTATSHVGSANAKQPQNPSQVPSRKQSKTSTSSNVPSTPGAAPSGTQTPVPIGYPQISQTPSVVIPYSETRASRPRLSIDTPGSCTPWKRTPRLSIPHSPTSPPRPRPEDVSPISERGSSPDALESSRPRERKTRRGQASADKAGPTVKTERASTTRRNRAISSASTHSRGRSLASREASPDETERDSRAGRRKGAAASVEESATKSRSKRKRGASEPIEEPVLPEPPKVDTTRYVVCTRGFHRTAAPILNDVTTHKLASIFAKPLGERDAPGYHDLIYRPQDLKSIKSSVHQGSKAVAAATEAVSTPAGDGESPAPVSGTPTKNNVLMLQKSEDLLPPRGIVNSAQLEKEFVRMFANAIMYNPVPERGFGPAFPMISERGSRESTQSSDGDEGGIIQDSREMFEDVEQAVTRWRAAERTADELANKNVFSLRRGSVSDFNTDSADDVKG
ncbi:hypothetical protein N7532_000735 [Penicillium argentinense]|uniref:Bromo domain-containing protein n=1 Tax=Penicillium argentinense TaxID=1131581 RepID=A0A9W9G5U4_9EURO|nr:uncharacterized protein N7532_000735 [Penicillium argentinense]KAJ5112690.1 hypothetical protein N7532_000735 [Penicillium argentinense]